MRNCEYFKNEAKNWVERLWSLPLTSQVCKPTIKRISYHFSTLLKFSQSYMNSLIFMWNPSTFSSLCVIRRSYSEKLSLKGCLFISFFFFNEKSAANFTYVATHFSSIWGSIKCESTEFDRHNYLLLILVILLWKHGGWTFLICQMFASVFL